MTKICIPIYTVYGISYYIHNSNSNIDINSIKKPLPVVTLPDYRSSVLPFVLILNAVNLWQQC